MSLLGIHLTILVGPTVPVPLPAPFAARLRSVKVTESDSHRSVFTLSFDAGRAGPLAAFDTDMMIGCPVVSHARVVILVTMGAVPMVLMDGIVTEVELVPGAEPGSSELHATGEDVTMLLNRVERDVEHIALEDSLQVLKILAPYAAQGIVPMVIPPMDMDIPLPIERVPTQQGTDLQHLQKLAAWHGYVTYAIPGPLPGTSTWYWGPAIRVGVPQPALSIDLGPETNVVGQIQLKQNATQPTFVEGSVQDPRLGATVPVETFGSVRPPLAAIPAWVVGAANAQRRRLRESGTSAISAFARAQAETDLSIDCVTGTGVLDGARYGSVLRPRGLVGVRGAGWSHDGLWYVTKVVHTLRHGSYKQKFTVVREGYGSTVPAVLV
jgi:hypothetical protein